MLASSKVECTRSCTDSIGQRPVARHIRWSCGEGPLDAPTPPTRRLSHEGVLIMRKVITATLVLLATTAAVAAQDAIPSLKGTWSGTGKILLYGTTEHLSGSPNNA